MKAVASTSKAGEPFHRSTFSRRRMLSSYCHCDQTSLYYSTPPGKQDYCDVANGSHLISMETYLKNSQASVSSFQPAPCNTTLGILRSTSSNCRHENHRVLL